MSILSSVVLEVGTLYCTTVLLYNNGRAIATSQSADTASNSILAGSQLSSEMSPCSLALEKRCFHSFIFKTKKRIFEYYIMKHYVIIIRSQTTESVTCSCATTAAGTWIWMSKYYRTGQAEQNININTAIVGISSWSTLTYISKVLNSRAKSSWETKKGKRGI